jgi:hypothetical protein
LSSFSSKCAPSSISFLMPAGPPDHEVDDARLREAVRTVPSVSGDVRLERVGRIEHGRDAALGPVRRSLSATPRFGDRPRPRPVLRGLEGERETGDAAAEHETIAVETHGARV